MSLRTINLYGGVHNFAPEDYLLGSIGLSREKIFTQIQQRLSHHKIDRVLCVPYHVEEVYAALALYELFGAKICTYIMDDQNILVANIPDHLMAELMAKSSLRLAISPEMRDVYQAKYKTPIYFVPPVIPAALVESNTTPAPLPSEQQGAIFGNIWSSQWLELLRTMTKGAGIQIDWYGNTGADWNFSNREQLSSDGIIERGFLPTEAEVINVLRNYAYVVVPSGTLDLRDDNLATSWLSLPSRIPFVLATANTPIIVLGSPNTAAAKFVERFGLGTVADYNPVSFRTAVAYITAPSVQQQLRANAVRVAHQFVNEQMDEWIWQSLALGKPIDDRFETLLADDADNYLSAFITCLDIIRGKEAEIKELKIVPGFKATLVRYLQKYPTSYKKIRWVWLKLKGQV